MTALEEIAGVPQTTDHHRRWFTSDSLDLIVWYDAVGAAMGFHLCYDKGREERAIIWSAANGLSFALVDDGEGALDRHKASPILVIRPGMADDRGRVAVVFNSSCADLPGDIVALVNAKLSQTL